MENNNENSGKSVGLKNLTPWQPGQSGNPKGRPKNPLKEYSLRQMENWTDKEKEEFLNKIPPIDRWRMTEGNPHQSSDTSVDANLIINIINFDGDNNTPPIQTEGLPTETTQGETTV